MVEALNEFTKLPIFISDDDLCVNIDLWERKEVKDLYILGLSGSGKSTLSRKYEKTHKNSSLIELDLFWGKNISGCKPMVKYAEDTYGGLNEFYNHTEKLKKEYTQANADIDNKINKENAKFGIFLRKHWDKQCIIEGIAVIDMIRYAKNILFKNNEFALIVKGTSVFTSFIRKFKRDGGLDELNRNDPNLRLDEKFIQYFSHYISRYYDWYTGINYSLKDLKSISSI